MGDRELLYAYFAGAIDADGFISVQRSSRKVGKKYIHQPTYYLAKVGFTGTNPLVQNLLRENFGGSFYTHQPKNPEHKMWYVWQAEGKQAKEVLRKIIPYLVIKKQQGEIALELIELKEQHWNEIKNTQKPPYRITPEMEAEQSKYWEAVTKLNEPRNRRVHFLETP